MKNFVYIPEQSKLQSLQ